MSDTILSKRYLGRVYIAIDPTPTLYSYHIVTNPLYREQSELLCLGTTIIQSYMKTKRSSGRTWRQVAKNIETSAYASPGVVNEVKSMRLNPQVFPKFLMLFFNDHRPKISISLIFDHITITYFIISVK